MATVSHLIERLQAQGWRITNVRRTLLEILVVHHKPLSVADILEATTRRGLEPNKTTVYRELERLKEEGIIREVLIDGKAQYVELIDEADHHHHLICTNCKRVEEVDFPQEIEKKIDELTRLIQRKTKFGTLNHSVDFFGVCRACK